LPPTVEADLRLLCLDIKVQKLELRGAKLGECPRRRKHKMGFFRTFAQSLNG
jgi:hypothetical protein